MDDDKDETESGAKLVLHNDGVKWITTTSNGLTISGNCGGVKLRDTTQASKIKSDSVEGLEEVIAEVKLMKEMFDSDPQLKEIYEQAKIIRKLKGK